MKKILAVIFSFLLLFAFAACTEAEEVLVVPSGSTLIEQGHATGVNVRGVGAEFDPHYFSQNFPDELDDPSSGTGGWEIITERVRELKLDCIRVMVLPEWLEPENDNDDPDTLNEDALTKESLEMQSLRKLLDLAMEQDISVTFVLWGASLNKTLAADNWSSSPYWMTANNQGASPGLANNWVKGPKDEMEDEFVENFYAYMKVLRVDEGYTCIKQITPVNEPCWSYQIEGVAWADGPNDTPFFPYYASMVRKLDEKFTEEGIRDLFEFNLGDATDTRAEKWLTRTVIDLQDQTDLVNAHTYTFGYETGNSAIASWTETNYRIANSIGADFFVGEFGSNQVECSTVQTDMNEYRRGVLMARIVSQMFNNGASGMSYWTIMDYYNNRSGSYDAMMKTGLWTSAKSEYSMDSNYNWLTENFQVRPQYYSFGLMSKYIPKGAEIYPMEIDSEFISGTAFAADGKTTYLFVNQTETPVTYSVETEGGQSYGYYLYAEDSLPEDDSLIAASQTLVSENRCLTFELPANSVVMLCRS